jgi:hypothetical protein
VVDDGLLMEDAEPFDHLIEEGKNIQTKANNAYNPQDIQSHS